ncbi:hypothetical protein Scep_007807 [Stephania cephalantha]|uniref:Uncharacterized protein n=1 Tax=Stephania cephalantha TaxID=152367 RepID=A0AAP0PP47_9MAGN
MIRDIAQVALDIHHYVIAPYKKAQHLMGDVHVGVGVGVGLGVLLVVAGCGVGVSVVIVVYGL